MRVSSSSFFIVVLIVGASLAYGCGVDDPDTAAVPVIGTALDRGYSANRGLVTGLGEHGWPFRDGPAMDPIITESRRFYDTLQSPYAVDQFVDYPDPFTGAPAGSCKTAPLTFDAWKQTFNIPARAPGESIADYRAAAGVVIYYNKNELGLGRELGCAEFDDGTDTSGAALIGIACYVTNYGTAFRDTNNSLRLAGEGLHPKNTVCITYRPSLDPDYQIQFYTYDGAGDRREWAQLDTLGPRPLPQVCMNCHGGAYDSEKHLAKFARFLPLDPNVVVFAEPSKGLAGLTRADQEERIRWINELSSRTPLTSAQDGMLDALYGGMLTVPGTASRSQWSPPAWSDTEEHRRIFDQVVKPNCTTCHAAMQNGPGGDVLEAYKMFASPASLLQAGLPGVVCGTFAMPNSQATLLNFWEPAEEPIVVGGVSYDTAADVLLAWIGTDRDHCTNLATLSDCNRGDAPDDLCGNAFGGRACNRITGRCVPEQSFAASADPAAPNGVCKIDGSRGCPYPEECRAAAGVTAGIESFDGVCVP